MQIIYQVIDTFEKQRILLSKENNVLVRTKDLLLLKLSH